MSKIRWGEGGVSTNLTNVFKSSGFFFWPHPQGVLYTFRPQMSLIFNISYLVTATPTPRDAITSKNASVVCVAYIDVSVGLIIFYNISSIL